MANQMKNPYTLAGIQQSAEDFVKRVLCDILGQEATPEQITTAANKTRTVIVAAHIAWNKNHERSN